MNKGSQQSKLRRVMSVLLKYVVPALISAGLCVLLFTGIDFGEMMAIVRAECDFRWIAAALGLSLFSYVFRALRWQLQLQALGIRVPLFNLVLSMFGTYAVNLVLPRLGEVWRSGYVAQRQDAPFTAVFGSMVAERCADTLTVGLVTLCAFAVGGEALLTYFSENAQAAHKITAVVCSPWLWAVGLLAVGALVALLKCKSRNKVIIKVQNAFSELWKGFAVIAKMPGKMKWIEWTLCVWGCYFTQMLISFFAFPATEGVVLSHGLAAVLVTFALSSISMGVPSNGGIGPWQWAVIFGLGIYGVAGAKAAAFANVVLGTQTLLQIILGVITFSLIALDKKKTKKHKTYING